MSQEKYFGMDVRQATISVAVADSRGKLIMESILETKAVTILEILQGLIFLLNNDGYTIERLIYGADSSYNDINPWDYGRLPAAMDPRGRAVIHCVRNEAELRWALQGATDSTKPHLIEIILPRMDAPDPLVRFAKRAAELDFPQLLEEEIDQVS